MKNKRYFRRLASLILILTLCAGLLSSCKKDPPEDPTTLKDDSEEFYLLMDELFAEWVSADGLSLNYFLADPDSFGIEDPDLTFGEATSPATILEGIQENQELLERLNEFEYNALNRDQQIVYDILIRNLSLIDIMYSDPDFPYYIGYIRPINGIQIQLPILLAEFNFRTEEDFDRYFILLDDVGRYFGEIIEFERERVRRGFFLSDANVDKVIEHIESFLTDREDNLLIAIFDDIANQFPGLSSRQRDEYIQRNRDLILDSLLPAYEMLLAEMRDLRGMGANEAGLASLPGGAEYAAAYLSYMTGSDRTPQNVDALFEQWMQTVFMELVGTLTADPQMMAAFSYGTLTQIVSDDPDIYLIRLQKAISEDYPQMAPISYVVREVHERLQEHVSPAFYLTPAIDRFYDNVIYINPPSITDDLSLFTILAHEGYPGHMYQIVYYLQQSPHPVRRALGNTGYSEGWATYAEMESYFYAGLPEVEASLQRLSKIYDLLFLGRIDLGVNALGWEIDQVADLCLEIGISDPDVVMDIYEMVIGNPLFYLPYCLGFIELSLLREEAEKSLRSDFELVEFHRFFLDFGSAPFPLIHEHMFDWITDERERARSRAA